ncbi:MAG TPA: ATP-binding protein [Candidatus Anoxymicrobiaceae bacterium]
MNNTLAAVALSAAFINALFGAYVLWRDSERLANRLFGCIAALLTIEAVNEFVLFMTKNSSMALLAVRITILQWCLMPAVFVHFAMAISGWPKERRRKYVPFLYAACAVLVVLGWSTGLIISGVATPVGSLHAYRELGGALYVPANLLVSVVDLVGIAIIFSARRRAESRASRGSLSLIMIAALLPLASSLITVVLLPAFGVYFPLGYAYLSPLTALLIGYAVIHYDFTTTVGSSLGRTVVESIRDAVLVVDDRGVIEEANSAVEGLTGFRNDRLVGLKVDLLFAGQPPDPLPGRRDDDAEWMLLRTQSGELVPVARSVGAVASRRGNLLGSVVVLHDMREAFKLMRAETEAREAAEAAEVERRHSEVLKSAQREMLERIGFLQKVLDNLTEPVFMKDRELRYIYVNRALLEFMEMEGEQLLNKTARDLFPEEQASLLEESDREVLETGDLVEIPEQELRVTRGQARTVRMLEAPVPDEVGRPEYIIGVINDVTVQRQMEKARLEFIRVAAHELGTPLTSLRLGVDLLAREMRDRLTEDEERSLEVLSLSTQRLILLSRKLLDLASIDAGMLVIERQEVRVEPLLTELTAMFEVQMREKGLRCTIECEDGDAASWADPERLLQVLSNLVGNAIKFTDAGTISISARDNGEGLLEFRVADTGCGIDAARIGLVFSRFSGTQNAIGTREGFGLGLSIAKAIVEAHGGRIWVESTPGVGSCFHFTVAGAPC